MTLKNEGDNYFVDVDERKIARLWHQHEAWRAETRELWEADGFRRGAKIIDLGSGPAIATLDPARTTVAQGKRSPTTGRRGNSISAQAIETPKR